MPKIPLYEEKIGQQKLAAGPLSRRADVSAFAAPALAVANFGKTVNQIAFDFGMEERRKEDEDTVKKLNNQFAEESAEWIRKNPRENTQVFKADFEKFKNEFVDFYATNLSSRRSRLVKNKINQTAAILNLQGQEKAYALSEKNATARDKNLLAVAADAMINSPLDSPEFTIALDNSNKIFEDAKLYGRNLGTTKYAYGLSITKGMYTKTAEDINSTTSLQDFKDRLSKNKELIPTEKAPLIALAEAIVSSLPLTDARSVSTSVMFAALPIFTSVAAIVPATVNNPLETVIRSVSLVCPIVEPSMLTLSITA